VAQLGVSAGFVARDHDEPPGDGLAPALCPVARRWNRGSGHSCRLTMPPWIQFRYSSVIVPSSFAITRL
jgi:hypothetical protein